jgi:hypothetical protein
MPRRTPATSIKGPYRSAGPEVGAAQCRVGQRSEELRDNDTANPSKSNCSGDCAKTWPPVLVQKGTKIFLNGVLRNQIGVVRRDDNNLQLTIGHWPVYRFSGDTQSGQTNGEGVKGLWFAVSPQGAKVTPAAGSGGGTGSGGSSTALGNGSVLLDSGKNFTEPDGSAGVSGPGCVNVANPNLSSSLTLTGGPSKIWTGRDCTGRSAADLAAARPSALRGSGLGA